MTVQHGRGIWAWLGRVAPTAARWTAGAVILLWFLSGYCGMWVAFYFGDMSIGYGDFFLELWFPRMARSGVLYLEPHGMALWWWRMPFLDFSVDPPLIRVPLWLLGVIASGLVAATWRFPRSAEGFCVSCGYDLTGNVSGRCPECGSSVAENRRPRSAARLWIVGFVTLVASVLVASQFSDEWAQLGRAVLPFTSAACALAWFIRRQTRKSRFLFRALAMIALVASTVALLKNVCDAFVVGLSSVTLGW